jgi:hypothetical protein
MIVRFATEFGSLAMLGESAVTLLRLGGHSGAVPGAILAEDLAAFAQRLRSGLTVHGDEPSPPLAHSAKDSADAEADEDRPTPIALRKRAVPLLDMIDTAIARRSGLMWDRD